MSINTIYFKLLGKKFACNEININYFCCLFCFLIFPSNFYALLILSYYHIGLILYLLVNDHFFVENVIFKLTNRTPISVKNIFA